MNRPDYDKQLEKFRKDNPVDQDPGDLDPNLTEEALGSRLHQLNTMADSGMWQEFEKWLEALRSAAEEEVNTAKSSFAAGRAYGRLLTTQMAKGWLDRQIKAAEGHIEVLRSKTGGSVQ